MIATRMSGPSRYVGQAQRHARLRRTRLGGIRNDARRRRGFLRMPLDLKRIAYVGIVETAGLNRAPFMPAAPAQGRYAQPLAFQADIERNQRRQQRTCQSKAKV